MPALAKGSCFCNWRLISEAAMQAILGRRDLLRTIVGTAMVPATIAHAGAITPDSSSVRVQAIELLPA